MNVGQSIYEYAPPIGFKEKAVEWLNTNVLFHESSMVYEMTIPGFGNTIRYGSPSSGGQIRIWMEELKLTTEEQILGFLTNLTVDRMVTVTEYQLYLSTLRAGLGSRGFDIKNTSREDAPGPDVGHHPHQPTLSLSMRSTMPNEPRLKRDMPEPEPTDRDEKERTCACCGESSEILSRRAFLRRIAGTAAAATFLGLFPSVLLNRRAGLGCQQRREDPGRRIPTGRQRRPQHDRALQ